MGAAVRRPARLLAIAALTAAAACARVRSGPYPLAFTASGRTPTFIEASREITVPMAIVNTGTREWDPSRVHLSYHWLWLIPRESASRSRTLPYQEGIRTEFDRRMAPGGHLSLDARLLAPVVAGVYWLQWDMVEEGATWFAQVAPRQPRQLVVVFPAPALAAAPVPLAVAVAALFALGAAGHRSRGAAGVFAETADAWWCGVSLFAKSLLFARAALLEPTSVATWLTVAAAAAPPLAGAAVLSRRVRPWVLWTIGTFGSVVLLGDVVYYRFFGDILSAPALLGSRQTGHVWQSVRSLLSAGLVWFVIDLPVALWVAAAVSRAPGPSRRYPRVAAASLGALALIGVALGAPRRLAATPLDQLFRDRAVAEQLGPFGYHAHDLWSYARAAFARQAASDAQVAAASAWFDERRPLRALGGPLDAAARGRNLIVVQVESLQEFAVDYVVGGQEVMPHLRRWSGGTIRFANVTDQTNQGRTSDAEFAAMTSLLPLDHGAVAFQFPANHYTALPLVLREHGYTTLSAVPFEAGFWNRAVMHPVYGFEHSLFEPDFVLTEQIGWGLDDRDFLQQMMPRLATLPQPFVAWLITLSLHHPFDNFPAQHRTLRLGPLEGTSFGNYLHAMRFFDAAFDEFVRSLASAGLLDRSVVMVFGDHDAGFPHDAETARRLGIAPTEAAWAAADRIPWFVRVPGLQDPSNGARIDTTPAGQTDFAPTLLGLLGIDAAPLPYMGRNVLNAPDDPPVLRPYGDWIDRGHLFISPRSAAVPAACFTTDGTPLSIGDCDAGAARARAARSVAQTVVVGDLQQRLRSAVRP